MLLLVMQIIIIWEALVRLKRLKEKQSVLANL